MSFRKTAMAFLAWSIICFAPTYAQGDGTLANVVAAYPSVLLNDLADYSLIQIDDQTRATAATAARNQEPFFVDFVEGPLEFSLSPLEMRAPNYQRITTGGERFSPNGPTTQFRGTVSGGEIASFTISPTFLMGQWELGGKVYLLEPLWLSAPAAPRDIYVRYRATDLSLPANECGVTKNQPDHFGQVSATPNKSSPGFREVGIAVVTDSLFYQKFSSDEETENFVLGLLALVQGDYDRGFEGRIQFQLTTLLLSRGGAPEGWSPTANAEHLINNFRNFGNSPAFEEEYDVATLMTDRDLIGTVIGIAFLDAMCDTNRYNVVQDWHPGLLGQRAVWGHEIGHSLGAGHAPEGRFIMSPTSDPNDDRWSSSTISAIERNVENYACLEPFGWQYLRLSNLPQGVRLSWEFADVDPHGGFLIQRALSPAGPWTEISRVSDFSSDEFRYADTDIAFGQTYYYRVIQFATDGTSCISQTRMINVPYIDGGRLSPNPTFGQVRVYSPGIEPRKYELFDSVGRLMWRGGIEQGSNLIDLSQLSAGVYIFVEEAPDGNIVVERIVRQ